ncbi:MAG: LLM class flavin-dependent oxidoreductase [Caulobacteraceae bacterium]
MPPALQQNDFGLPSDTGGKDLGVFLPMANGGWILSSTAPRLDGSYAYNREVAKLADSLGLDFIMAMAKWKGFGGANHHWRTALDSQIMMAALAEVTSKVKVWTTVHTLLQNPAVTAKMIATLDEISGGRAGLNIVTGAYKDEFDQMGAWRDGVSHDQRYDLAAEWITCIKRLWAEDAVDLDGKYFQLKDCESFPKPAKQPFLVCAGASKRGMEFTLEHTDAIFLSGQDDAELGRNSRQAKAMAADAGRRMRTYMMTTLVIGDTDAEAQRTADSYRQGFDEGALRGMLRAYGFLDAEMGKENAFITNARSGFMTSRLIGSAQSVYEQSAELLESCDLDGMMLIFPDYIKGLPVFAAEILPKLRARFPARTLETVHAA